MPFAPINTLDGSDWHGKMRDVILDGAGADAYQGDMMVGATNLAADEARRVVPAATAAAGNTLLGALVEVYPTFTDEGSLTRNYFESSGGDGEGRVVFGDDIIYEAQEDADASTIDGADIGGSVDLIQVAPTATNQLTGISSQLLDSSTAAADLLQALEILRLSESQGQAFALAGGASFQVKINPVA